ncbi:hypothetical protein GCM10010524_38100 [Streptomyces mexicanus]
MLQGTLAPSHDLILVSSLRRNQVEGSITGPQGPAIRTDCSTSAPAPGVTPSAPAPRLLDTCEQRDLHVGPLRDRGVRAATRWTLRDLTCVRQRKCSPAGGYCTESHRPGKSH